MTEPTGLRPVRSITNLAQAIVAQAAARPGLRLGTADDQLALGDSVELAAGRAQALLGAGLRPGQRVALVAPTSTDYIITWLACLLAGAPVALVNPTYPDELTRRMLAPLAPDLVPEVCMYEAVANRLAASPGRASGSARPAARASATWPGSRARSGASGASIRRVSSSG